MSIIPLLIKPSPAYQLLNREIGLIGKALITIVALFRSFIIYT